MTATYDSWYSLESKGAYLHLRSVEKNFGCVVLRNRQRLTPCGAGLRPRCACSWETRADTR
ncbi:jg14657, partial [Pararge aegeria aegeria]